MESHHPSSYRAPFNAEQAAFDDGHLVLTASPDIDEDAPLDNMPGAKKSAAFGPEEIAEIERQAMARGAFELLKKLCEGNPTDKEVGRRALLRLHRLTPGVKTNVELARQMDVTHQRVAQLLEAMDSTNSNVFNGN